MQFGIFFLHTLIYVSLQASDTITILTFAEEELKRLHASIASDEQDKGLGEVAYQYDEEEGEQYDPTEPTNDEEDDQKVFIAPSSLAVPSEMEIVSGITVFANCLHLLVFAAESTKMCLNLY